MFNTYYDKIYKGEGGTINFTKNFIKNFSKKNHELVGLILHGKKEKDNIIEVSRTKRKDHEILDVTLRLNSFDIVETKKRKIPKSTVLPRKLLCDFFLQEKPDIFFLNGFSIAYWYLFDAATKAGIPVVVVHHGLWFKEFKNISKKSTKEAFFLMRKMERDVSRRAAKEVFLNELCLKEYEKGLKIKVDKKRAAVISYPYNEIFTKGSKKLKSRKDDRALKIGMVGRWDPIKNPQALIDLSKAAKKNGKDWRFFLVTRVSKNHVLKSQKKVISRHVEVVPPMPPKKLAKFFQRMDLLILPSEFETFASVVSEAILQKRFTLVSPNVGWSDIYRKNELENWIIDFGDPYKVIERIEKNCFQEVPKQFLNYFEKEFRAKKIFDDYEKLFKSIKKKI
ncbi:MAG: hypothetical protein UW63_C0052G0005 [Candidatus Uhrbacteria bacterium GW2011_GWF2_44_350]|nr:MAG: hypothetical protein UW63_C0052G0005 [Candidatus Uhrbacteria bacterium GW2011_GWF2_44_350]